jgi:hypothetical protein
LFLVTEATFNLSYFEILGRRIMLDSSYKYQSKITIRVEHDLESLEFDDCQVIRHITFRAGN